ncbi:MAG: EcsC family protein [Flavipsychrobacter sp.]|nr:EcsC family protein [Flavipsychrobacter sp.]
MKLHKPNFKALGSKFKAGFTYLSKGGLQQIFKHIDQLSIKKGVDELGLEKFINQCALLAAGSGVIIGAGGLATIAIGVPLDMINLITQQFRVTLAVSYHNTGKYEIRFEDFIKIVAASFKKDAGVTITKNLLKEVAEKLMINIGSKTAERLIPVVGAVIGGSANYFFIKRVAKGLMDQPLTTPRV